MGIETGFQLFGDLTNNVTMFGLDWIPSLIFTILICAMLTRVYSQWKELAFPVMGLLGVMGLRVNLFIFAGFGFLWVLECLSTPVISEMLGVNLIKDRMRYQRLEGIKGSDKFSTPDTRYKQIAIAGARELKARAGFGKLKFGHWEVKKDSKGRVMYKSDSHGGIAYDKKGNPIPLLTGNINKKSLRRAKQEELRQARSPGIMSAIKGGDKVRSASSKTDWSKHPAMQAFYANIMNNPIYKKMVEVDHNGKIGGFIYSNPEVKKDFDELKNSIEDLRRKKPGERV